MEIEDEENVPMVVVVVVTVNFSVTVCVVVPVLDTVTVFGALVLPTGAGLFAVSDLDGAVAAVQKIAADPAVAGHAAACPHVLLDDEMRVLHQALGAGQPVLPAI